MLKGAFGEKNRNNFFTSVQEKLREKKRYWNRNCKTFLLHANAKKLEKQLQGFLRYM